MAEPEPFSAKIWIRVTPSQLARWQEAIEQLGVRRASDFYRTAIDEMADAVLEPEPATIPGS